MKNSRPIIKATYNKLADSIKLNGEILKPIPLKSGTRQGCLFSPYLFSIAMEILVRVIRVQKKIKGLQIGRVVVKVSLFADDMLVYIRDPKNSTQELL